jgi:hypothetical protein
MNKLALPIAALVFASLPLGAFAATVGVNTNATTSTSVTASNSASASTNTAATVNGSFSSKSSFGDVMGSLSTPKTSASIDLTTIHPRHVKFVLVSKLNGYTAAGLKISRANMKNMAALDAKVAADASLTASLKKAGYLPSHVVAVSTSANGDMTVFVAK